VIRPIDFSLSKEGYVLCIVNTGGNHADLNEDYASVPAEMKKVASYFGKPVLRGITAAQIVENLPILRPAVGDRACLRALHFVEENDRVEKTAEKLEKGDVAAFLSSVIESGNSSFRYLQNVYTVKNVEEQGLSLALALSEKALRGKDCAWRVHGGGFAGTVQAFVKEEEAEGYRALMDSVFGEGACMMLRVRKEGAIAVTL
jgi:galactokinase